MKDRLIHTSDYSRLVIHFNGYKEVQMDTDMTFDLSHQINSIIKSFLDKPNENTLWQEYGERAWGDPLVGFSRGGDPLWLSFKDVIGPFHWAPAEIFSQAFPTMKITAGELTIISWVLPQTEATKADNHHEASFPSHRWARTRTYGEEINNSLKRHVVSSLQALGYEAVAPTLHDGFSWQNSDIYGFASNWSERHVAYISGLGTFGLCDGLITPIGKAMRLGSVVAHMQIPPTPRPYSSHTDYCLFFSKGACRKCISRCPAGAISEAGHDKGKCLEYLAGKTILHIKSNYGFDGYSCGLCQTGVPCESKIPLNDK
jgi:epoxyqueuosine reductase